MIKNIIPVLLFLLFPKTILAQETKNYLLIINKDTIQTDLELTNKYKLKNGETLEIVVKQKETSVYNDNFISFSYPSNLKVSATKLDQSINQLSILKSTGNGYMIQTYSSLNPTSIIDLMIHELTKESIRYGYKKEEFPSEFKIASGQTLRGKKVVLTYKNEKEVYNVLSYGGNDEGILVVTLMLNEEYQKEDTVLIDLFLKSLKLI